MSLIRRIRKLEGQAASAGTAAPGIVAPWALAYVRENKAKMMEGRTGEILRELGVAFGKDPAADEADTLSQAQYLTKTYPNLEACRRGEAKRAERIRALLAAEAAQ